MKTIQIVDENENIEFEEEVSDAYFPKRMHHLSLQAELWTRDRQGTFTAREKPVPPPPEPEPEPDPDPAPEEEVHP